MLGPIFFDDVNNCGDFFDNIEDFLDFPDQAVEGDLVGGDFDNFQGVWSQPPQQQPPQMDALAASTTVISDTKNTTTSSELPVPYEDFPPLEWLSSFMEDSFSPGSTIPDKDTIANTTDVKSNNSRICSNNNNTNNFQHQFQTSSPVSVLESSSSCSDGKTMPLNSETFIRGRARSKRPRPAAFNPRSVTQLISPTSSITEATTTSSELLSEVGNHAESRLMMKISEPNTSSESKQKKKIKIKKRNLPPLPGSMDHQTGTPSAATVRKCMHCEISKTPQWRAGPMGPKTLCNACGVRFKSGRLYPEYRPAASPTFVAALHSNSHKKVLEMRIRSCEKLQKPEFMPSSGHLVEQV